MGSLPMCRSSADHRTGRRRRPRSSSTRPEPADSRPVEKAAGHRARDNADTSEERTVNSIIYLVGLVVIVLFILSFLGLR
jgi:hypothetical protein